MKKSLLFVIQKYKKKIKIEIDLRFGPLFTQKTKHKKRAKVVKENMKKIFYDFYTIFMIFPILIIVRELS